MSAKYRLSVIFGQNSSSSSRTVSLRKLSFFYIHDIKNQFIGLLTNVLAEFIDHCFYVTSLHIFAPLFITKQFNSSFYSAATVRRMRESWFSSCACLRASVHE